LLKQRKQDLLELKNKLGLNITNFNILDKALTHSSYAHEKKELSSNETLEFMGDAVLGLVVCEYLYQNFPACNEGHLSQIKSVVVSATVLASKATELGLGEYLLLGKGEAYGKARQRPSLLADTLEALIGAVYLDGELKEARPFILGLLIPEIQKIRQEGYTQDYKSVLQELSQRKWRVAPVYQLITSQGPDHDKTFEIKVCIKNKILGVGKGKSKKEAEQAAAERALLRVQRDQQDGAEISTKEIGRHQKSGLDKVIIEGERS